MVINSCKKIGFSLLEAMVVMVIAAIFVAVIANSIPHKSKPKLSAEAHGGYECYWKNNKLYSRAIVIGTEASEKEESGECCSFKPNQYVNYIVFNVVGGGARGGEDTSGGAGAFRSAFFSTPNFNYQLCPGKGGNNSSPNGQPSSVKSGDKASDKVIVEADGGSDLTSIQNTTVSDISDVFIDKKMDANVIIYGCKDDATARFDLADKKIHIEFCRTKNDKIEKTLEYSNPAARSVKDKYQTVLQSPLLNTPLLSYDKPNNQLIYYDIDAFLDAGIDPKNNSNCSYDKITAMNDPMCPSRYKLIIKLIDRDTVTSDLTKYARLMQFSNLADVKPGDGGAKGKQNGSAGAVLVVW